MENIEYPFDLMYQIIQQMDLSICFDTGHLLAGFSGQISVMEFIDKYYDRIIELNLQEAIQSMDYIKNNIPEVLG